MPEQRISKLMPLLRGNVGFSMTTSACGVELMPKFLAGEPLLSAACVSEARSRSPDPVDRCVEQIRELFDLSGNTQSNW